MKGKKCVGILLLIHAFFVCFCGPYFQTTSDYVSIQNLTNDISFAGISAIIISILIVIMVITYCTFFTNANKVKIIFLPLDLLCIVLLFLSAKIASLFGLIATISFIPIALAIYTIILFFVLCSQILEKFTLTTMDIVEIALFVGLALVLDLAPLKFKVVPQGGSISLTMLPLMILSLRKGFIKGFIGAGILFGLINCLTDGYGLVTYPLDYFIGFGSVAIFGLFRTLIYKRYSLINIVYYVIAGLLTMTIRVFASTLSGILFFNYTFVASLIYQLTYIPAAVAASTIVAIILYRPLFMLNQRQLKRAK
ncbi:MAG: energy-coupled thiamine transporter ThiT [Bacilli bacterium]|nr:energy-coupled thiamine transporter ThiT [Bacilli bacterium]